MDCNGGMGGWGEGGTGKGAGGFVHCMVDWFSLDYSEQKQNPKYPLNPPLLPTIFIFLVHK